MLVYVHAEDDFLGGHICDVLDDDLSFFQLSEVLVELRDDLRAMLREPRRALLLRQLEDGIVELLQELDGARRNLVYGLAELGADSEDAASLLRVCTLPLRVIDTRSRDDEVLGRRARAVCLLRDHDATGE